MAGTAPLTPLGVAALSLLAERPMHPYEMYQLLIQRRGDRLVKVRPGTLYHGVGRLAEDGLVEATGTEREGNRPERTTYRISAAGRAALRARLRELLAVPLNEYPGFPLAVSEAYHLPREEVLALLERRLGALECTAGNLSAATAAVEGKELAPKYWLDIRYQQAILQSEIDWITKLHTELRSGAIHW
ncbi:MAG: PadR family transcriptional regulator [Actinomycetales bacterium]